MESYINTQLVVQNSALARELVNMWQQENDITIKNTDIQIMHSLTAFIDISFHAKGLLCNHLIL